MSKFRLIVFFFLVQSSLAVNAQILENYDGQWKIAREESWLGSNNQIELRLDLLGFPESKFQIRLPSESTVFIDQKLWRLTTGDTVFYSDTKDLREEFAKDTVTLIVVSPNLASQNASVKKIVEKESDVEMSIVPDRTPLYERFVPQSVKDFYFTALFLILFFLAFYKLAYPYLLAVLLQPVAVVRAEDFSDSGNIQKFFSIDIILYLLIVGMMLSEAVVMSLVIFQKEWLETWIGLDYSSLLLVWLIGAIVISLFFVAKFIGIRIVSYLFDLGKAEFSHFFYLLRLVVFGCILLILVCAYFVVNNYSGLESALSLLISGFFWLYIFGMLGLFLIMMNRLSFKKYHLFTYLCIAELIPFLILSRWIMYLG